MAYILVRKWEDFASEGNVLIHYDVDEPAGAGVSRMIADGDIRVAEAARDPSGGFNLHLTGQALYSVTGDNRWTWRSKYGCTFMGDTHASPFSETNCFPIIEACVPVIPHDTKKVDELLFDRYTIDPKDFSTCLMGCFGRKEREDIASIVLWAAQQAGTFAKEFWVKEVREALGWKPRTEMNWYGMDDTSYRGGAHSPFKDTTYTGHSPVYVRTFRNDADEEGFQPTESFINQLLLKANRAR